jgi:hypothetical protein
LKSLKPEFQIYFRVREKPSAKGVPISKFILLIYRGRERNGTSLPSFHENFLESFSVPISIYF